MSSVVEINERIAMSVDEILFSKYFNDEVVLIEDSSMNFLLIKSKLGFNFKVPKWIFTVDEKQFENYYFIPMFLENKIF